MSFLISRVSVFSSLFLALSLSADWVRVVDFEEPEYRASRAKADLQELGWIFQDYAFAAYPQCSPVQGNPPERDCTGVYQVIEAPYGVEGRVLLHRGSNPNEPQAANTRSNAAFDLPEEIPLSSSRASLYLRFAYERPAVSAHFGLTDNNNPSETIASQAPFDWMVTHDYNNLRVGTQFTPQVESTVTIFDGTWRAATLEPGMVIAEETWYEFWYHIDNNGGTFDAYIKGGVWTEQTHLGNPHTTGYTDYEMRAVVGQPREALRRFLSVLNPGTPATVIRQGAAFYDDIYMSNGEFLLTTPPDRIDGGGTVVPPIAESLWADVAVIAPTVWKQTGLGYIYDDMYQWIYIYEAQSWLYVDSGSTLQSLYLYNSVDGSWLWTAESFGGWYYNLSDPSQGVDGWAHWSISAE